MTQFYDRLLALVEKLVDVYYYHRLYEEEANNIAFDAVSSILFRLQRGSLPETIVAWTQYMKRVIHGCYVSYINSTQNPDKRPEVELVSFIEGYDSFTKNEAEGILVSVNDTPRDILIREEKSKKYFQECIKKISKLSKNDENLSIIGFICYFHNLDVHMLSLSEPEIMLTELITNSFDYYFRVGAPEGVEVNL